MGVATIVVSPDKPGCVLIGRRRSSHGYNKYAFPGGHLEVCSYNIDTFIRHYLTTIIR